MVLVDSLTSKLVVVGWARSNVCACVPHQDQCRDCSLFSSFECCLVAVRSLEEELRACQSLKYLENLDLVKHSCLTHFVVGDRRERNHGMSMAMGSVCCICIWTWQWDLYVVYELGNGICMLYMDMTMGCVCCIWAWQWDLYVVFYCTNSRPINWVVVGETLLIVEQIT